MTPSTAAAPGKASRHERWPGEPGVWSFICADMVLFAVMFLSFSYDRTKAPQVFHEAHLRLNEGLGLINTVMLLLSSWCVASAVRAARAGRITLARVLLGATITCALVFCAVKYIEYSDKIRHGLTLNTNAFFQYYYMMTGIHLLHVLIGVIVLGVLMVGAGGATPIERRADAIETGASYWHMVDLLWIVLFALLYLIG